jgi:hypothetical protein
MGNNLDLCAGTKRHEDGENKSTERLIDTFQARRASQAEREAKEVDGDLQEGSGDDDYAQGEGLGAVMAEAGLRYEAERRKRVLVSLGGGGGVGVVH